MSPAILTEDILHHIVSHLTATHSESVRRTLARLARVHSTFTQPALALLWRSLPNIQPLEHLLGLVGIAQQALSTLELCGTPTSHGSAWARVQEYTFLVREITLNLFVPASPYQDGFDISLDLLEAGFRDTFWYQLSSTFGATQILPRLEVVTLSSSSCGLGARYSDLVFDMGMLCFLGPTVRAFNVDAPQMDPERHLEFVHAFTACFSSVQDLEVISLDTLVPVLDIGSLPQLHPRLRRLIFQPFIDSDEISHLASLHNLEHLSGKLRPPTLPVQLLGLRSLAVSTYTSNEISAFVADMDAPQLQSFSMSQLYGNPEEIYRELSDVLRVLVAKRPSLTAFSWNSDQRTGRGERSDALADRVAPLLSIRTIRNFSAYLRGYMVSYTPSSIRAFAEAWPDLEVFDLRTADVEDDGNDNDNVPYADLESLVSFARHCPRLQRLYIPRVKFDRDAAAAVVRPPAPHWLHSFGVAEVVLCGEQDEDGAAGGDLFGSLMHEIFPAAKIGF